MPCIDPLLTQSDLLPDIFHDQGGNETFSDVFLSRLSVISQYFANVEAATTSITASTISEFEDIFSSLTLEPSDSPSSSQCIVSPIHWLLDNLHNPYPSGVIRRTMEHAPELKGRSVNEWYARARQRIGWTRLLRDRFNGCRSAATDAAFRAFVRDDPRSPLDPELYAAFMAVKAHANLVYDPPSPRTLGITPHPSPPSRSLSATPSLTHSADSEDDDSASRPSRKRKRPHSEIPSESHAVSPPPQKRRLSSPERVSSVSRSPFPWATPANNDSPPPPPRSRKRRLSESNSDEPVVKKPREANWAPRQQRVSDPLPLSAPSFDWESWCTEAFSLPASATTNHPVPEALDFELFNFEAFPASQTTDITESLTGLRPEPPEHPDKWLNSLFVAPTQTEKGSWPASWENLFSFEPPCHLHPVPSLTNSPSPSTPDTQWSLSPPELPDFESLGSPLFDFSSPSMFKIPALYPTHGVAIVDSTPLIS